MGENKNIHRSTSRVLDVLELVAGSPEGYTLSEISHHIEAPKSSMFPIISTLVSRGYLFLTKDMHYKIDRTAFQVGNSYLEHLNIMEEVENILSNIVNVCLETCHFAILNAGNVVYLKKIDSPESIRMISTVGKQVPAYGTALGKSLLIDYSEEELREIYPNGLLPLTDNTITDFSVLSEQLKEAHNEGFTYEVEESNQYIRCLSVPIRKQKKVVAAISVAIPTFRYTDDKTSLIKALLIDAKSKLESILKNIDIDFTNII